MEDYPRVMYEAGKRKDAELEPREAEFQQEGTGQQQNRGGEGGGRRRGRYDKRESAGVRRQEAT